MDVSVVVGKAFRNEWELSWEQEHLNEGRYTLDMVRIDHKVREVISDIKMKEAELAQHVNKVDDSAPQVSVAT